MKLPALSGPRGIESVSCVRHFEYPGLEASTRTRYEYLTLVLLALEARGNYLSCYLPYSTLEFGHNPTRIHLSNLTYLDIHKYLTLSFPHHVPYQVNTSKHLHPTSAIDSASLDSISLPHKDLSPPQPVFLFLSSLSPSLRGNRLPYLEEDFLPIVQRAINHIPCSHLLPPNKKRRSTPLKIPELTYRTMTSVKVSYRDYLV